VFGDASLKRLTHIGLHGWRNLDKDELLELLDRPSELRSLRLRHLSLVAGKWKDILQHIRLDFDRRLDFISLRGVTYSPVAAHAITGGQLIGAPIPMSQGSDEVDFEDSNTDENSSPLSQQNMSDSEESSESTSNAVAENLDGFVNEPHLNDLNSDDNSEQSLSSSDDETEDFEEPSHIYYSGHLNEGIEDSGNESEMDPIQDVTIEDSTAQANSPSFGTSTTARLPYRPSRTTIGCQCVEGYAWEDLEDNGVTVDRSQWRMWERWVVNRCPVCDHIAVNNSS
jgi:hypothetical protein